MSKMLSGRDIEILRTVLRTRLAPTGLLADTFFPQRRVARRRLQALRERGLIAPHVKGSPPTMSGQRYWRLAPRGLNALAAACPEEPIPDNLVARTGRASLRQWEHRDAVSELYVAFVRDPKGDLEQTRRRADAITWLAEWDVELHYEAVEAATLVPRHIRPDATIELSGQRIFLEMDRSTETHTRIRDALQAYHRYLTTAYARDYPDGRTPSVLYVTRSSTRERNLSRLAAGTELASSVRVVSTDAAARLLSELAFDLAHEIDAPPAPAPASSARMVDVALLRALYVLAREGVMRRMDAGEINDKDGIPDCLHAAHALLSQDAA